MNRQTTRWWAILALLTLMTGPALAQDDDAALRKDLTAVIALLGLPCGEVVDVTRQGDSDNLVLCQDGHRYRIYISEAGRVEAQRLNAD